MTKKSEFGEGREFFSEWHRDAAVDGYERELAAAKNRLAELEAMEADTSVAEEAAKVRIENAQRELKRLTGQRGASKRPAGSDKETR